jgi:hypothetical protein
MYSVIVKMVKFVDLNGESYNTIAKFIIEKKSFDVSSVTKDRRYNKIQIKE